MAELVFTKVEGLGNDFLLVDRRSASVDAVEHELRALSALAPRACDRRTGVGGDGILVLGPPREDGHDASMWVINHDGSRPQMCGNGLRCVALVVAGTGTREVTIDTDAGPRRCRVTADAIDAGEVEVDMGPGVELGEHRPTAGEGRTFTGISMGNPHAVTFVGPSEDPEALARRIGPGVERSPEYPEGTNVELAQVRSDGVLLWVWERGCGITQACGTGACATAVAAVRAGLQPSEAPIAVHLPGGSLEIRVPAEPSQGVRMRGPARVVFEGRLAT
ncbi:diaminopimelate epimerase [Paraliomyxa miuraensis]|uniref:diaminopimelate epimerase n=1 Tax=Paraliomyxa miuraensis TaxID=376150 RepID=UPI00224D7DBB|nr:diaminopimelate epimerase [Paraliomyxa miuraensis]MCX4244697.1 diaminopimelate epimerase [Paraliomyxa miuraensis]